MKILFLVLSSKTHNHRNEITIDRVDLTRRLDAINTWGQDAIESGHELIFFQGGSETEFYDEPSRTLNLVECDDYEEPHLISPLFVKIQAALRWAKNNVSFDIIYLCDDDVFVNVPEFLKGNFDFDFISSGALGGGGFYFSHKAVDVLCNVVNTEFVNADVAIFSFLTRVDGLKMNISNAKNFPFYFPAELFSTVHYVTGKRSYHYHNTLKFFQENGYTNRKVVFGGPLDAYKRYDIVSYESKIQRKTPRWYDYVRDKNNWEYHGGYARSLVRLSDLERFWPYGENSIKKFVVNFNYFLNDYKGSTVYEDKFKFLISKCEYSLMNKENLFLVSEKEENLNGWVVDNSLKEEHKLDFGIYNDWVLYRKIK